MSGKTAWHLEYDYVHWPTGVPGLTFLTGPLEAALMSDSMPLSKDPGEEELEEWPAGSSSVPGLPKWHEFSAHWELCGKTRQGYADRSCGLLFLEVRGGEVTGVPC